MDETHHTTLDAFLGGRIVVRQPKKGFRSGMDAVLVAAACPAEAGERVIEAGCGAGVATLCLAARARPSQIVGVDFDPSLVDLARANAERNDLAHVCRFLCADVLAPASSLESLGIGRDSFEHALANPPFHFQGQSRVPSDARRARAQVMAKEGLDGWMRFLASTVAGGGTATLIHTAAALPALLAALDGRFGALRVVPIHPRKGEAAIRVVITGKKASRAPMSILPGLILHTADGAPSAAATALARDGATLSEALGL